MTPLTSSCGEVMTRGASSVIPLVELDEGTGGAAEATGPQSSPLGLVADGPSAAVAPRSSAGASPSRGNAALSANEEDHQRPRLLPRIAGSGQPGPESGIALGECTLSAMVVALSRYSPRFCEARGTEFRTHNFRGEGCLWPRWGAPFPSQSYLVPLDTMPHTAAVFRHVDRSIAVPLFDEVVMYFDAVALCVRKCMRLPEEDDALHMMNHLGLQRLTSMLWLYTVHAHNVIAITVDKRRFVQITERSDFAGWRSLFIASGAVAAADATLSAASASPSALPQAGPTFGCETPEDFCGTGKDGGQWASDSCSVKVGSPAGSPRSLPDSCCPGGSPLTPDVRDGAGDFGVWLQRHLMTEFTYVSHCVRQEISSIALSAAVSR